MLGPDAGGSRRTSRASAAIARGSSSSSCSVAMNSLSSACSTGHCHVRKKIKKKPARSQCGSPVCLLHWPLSRRDKRETHYRTHLEHFCFTGLYGYTSYASSSYAPCCTSSCCLVSATQAYTHSQCSQTIFFWFAHFNGLRAPDTGSHEIPQS